MCDCLTDVPVLLIFFNRPKTTERVFEAIKKARPSRLYLYQDGIRSDRPDDIAKVEKCREIVSNIDWNCEVKQKYQERNFGCDPSEYIAQKWMFESEEYGIILEDDDVPAACFFEYCRELLIKYKDNDRIQMICGYNPIDEYKDCRSDYFFSRIGSIWGWATWKRVVDTWDDKYTWMNDPAKVEKVINSYPSKRERDALKITCATHRESGVAYYETINASNMMLYDRLAINPKYNMISNIGVGNETTHSTNDIRLLNRYIQKLLYKEVHEYSFPLKHPEDIVCDEEFKRLVDIATGNSNNYRIFRAIEYVYRQFRYGNGKSFINKQLKKLKKRVKRV